MSFRSVFSLTIPLLAAAALTRVQVDEHGAVIDVTGGQHLHLLQSSTHRRARQGQINPSTLPTEGQQVPSAVESIRTSEGSSAATMSVDDVLAAMQVELRRDFVQYFANNGLFDSTREGTFKTFPHDGPLKANPRFASILKRAVARALQHRLDQADVADEQKLSHSTPDSKSIEPVALASTDSAMNAPTRSDEQETAMNAPSHPMRYPMKPHGETTLDDIWYAVESELKHDVSSYWIQGDYISKLRVLVSDTVDTLYEETIAKMPVNQLAGNVLKVAAKQQLRQKIEELDATMKAQLEHPQVQEKTPIVAAVSLKKAAENGDWELSSKPASLSDQISNARHPKAHLDALYKQAARRLANVSKALDRPAAKRLARELQRNAKEQQR